MYRPLNHLKFTVLLLALAPIEAYAQDVVLTRQSAQCLLDNRAGLAAMSDCVLFLNVAVCPPETGGNDSTIDQTGANRVATADGEVNTIVIINKAKIDCYMTQIESAMSGGGSGNVNVSFDPCK
jgi:hypothetical protein